MCFNTDMLYKTISSEATRNAVRKSHLRRLILDFFKKKNINTYVYIITKYVFYLRLLFCKLR